MPTIEVRGMTCQHCVAAVTKALESIDGIADVQVDLESGKATYREEKPVDPDVVRKSVEDAGYEVA